MKRNYNVFYNNLNTVTITMVKEKYSRTGSGKSWKRSPDTIEKEIVSPEFYKNYIESVHFFNNWGSCRAYSGYTVIGYLPIKVTTISPFNDTKTIARFTFK